MRRLLNTPPEVVVPPPGNPYIPDLPGYTARGANSQAGLARGLPGGGSNVRLSAAVCGCETALHLSEQGCQVTIVEALDEAAR